MMTNNNSNSYKSPVADGNNNMYVHAIPYSVRKTLCAILDDQDNYKKLATNMKYDTVVIQEIKQAAVLGRSPSDKLLTMWSYHNHTVNELFYLLYKSQSFFGMEAIKNLVDRRYHGYLLKVERPALSIFDSEPSTKTTNTENNNIARRVNKDKPASVKILNGSSNSNNASDEKSGESDSKCIYEYASEIPRIDYHELEVATNNWDIKCQLGKGGFGTVYQGDWKKTLVAIKRLTVTGNNKFQMSELKFLNAARHDNILPLYGYSISEGKPPCLVCQLMPGRSLDFRLLKNMEFPPLTWRQRFMIAQGTARGLQFLHTSKAKPLIHGDIKPANILLDTCCQPKIADFGLAREISISSNSSISMVSRVFGTRPYLPREFVTDRLLSTKVDTYSFGVVLYQLATGKKAYDPERKSGPFLTAYMDLLVEHNILEIDQLCEMDAEGMEIARILIILGQQCTKDSSSVRPEMIEVLERLDTVKLRPREQNQYF